MRYLAFFLLLFCWPLLAMETNNIKKLISLSEQALKKAKKQHQATLLIQRIGGTKNLIGDKLLKGYLDQQQASRFETFGEGNYTESESEYSNDEISPQNAITTLWMGEYVAQPSAHTALVLSPGNFALCSYKKVATTQAIQIVISSNYYLTLAKNNCYTLVHDANPHKSQIIDFINPDSKVEKSIIILIASSLDEQACRNTQELFKNLSCPSNFYFYDINEGTNEYTNKEFLIQAHLYKDLTEYVSWVGIGEKGLFPLSFRI